MYIVTGSIHREQGILSTTAQDEGQTSSETEAESDVESLPASDQFMLVTCHGFYVVRFIRRLELQGKSGS
jgi:hypothetical protein